MNLHQVGKATIEVKSKAKSKMLEILCNVFVLNFIALIFIHALLG